MDRSRFLQTLVPTLAVFAIGTVLLHACRDDRPTAPSTPLSGATLAETASTAVIYPTGDTYLNIDAGNYATEAQLNLYTWPDAKPANAILITFDLASIPPGSTVSSASLTLNLIESDATTDPTYTVTAHAIVNRNPDLAAATGYTYDGVNSWTPNTCCYNNVPLAQADIGPSVATQEVDKTPGLKQWDVTSVVQGWLTDPSTNFGLLMNSDPSKLRDRYRTFSSSEDPVTNNRPYLTVVYTPPVQPPPGQDSSVFHPAADTYLNIDAQNNAGATLNLYTWPDAKPANAILMRVLSSNSVSGRDIRSPASLKRRRAPFRIPRRLAV